MQIYEVIKKMNIDEMAEHHARYARAAIQGALSSMGLTMNEMPPLEESIRNQRAWLLSENK